MGILLVATGLLLLLSELQGFDGATMIFRWWPVILIILGIEILAYILFSGEEQPKIKFDGLSIFLTIFIVLVSSGVYAASTFFKSEFSQSILGEMGFFQNESVVDKSYDLEASGVKKLHINNSKGRIRIDKYVGDKIKVDVSIVLKNNDEEEAVKLAQDLVEVVEGETVTLHTRKTGIIEDNRNYEVNVNYDIKVPKGLDFDIENKFGEITLKDLTGNIQVEGEFGEIEVENINGNVQIENAFGETRVQDVSGKVDIDSEQGGVFLNSKNIVTNSILINNKMGEITVELPSLQDGSFNASSQMGEITWEGFQSQLLINRENTKQTLQGIVGTNSPVFTLKAEQGGINLIGR